MALLGDLVLRLRRAAVEAVAERDDLALARVKLFLDERAECFREFGPADLFEDVVLKGDDIHEAQLAAGAVVVDGLRE